MNTIRDRLILIRKAYNMSYEEIGALCETISRQAYNAWENGTRAPSVDALVEIATKFGFSIDWLCGTSPEPYTENSVLFAEKSYYEGDRWNEKNIDTKFLWIFDPYEPQLAEEALQNYSQYEIRKNNYSLEARANILVLLRYPSAISQTSSQDNFLPGVETGVNLKKRRKYIQVISQLKTVINTGKEIYRITE